MDISEHHFMNSEYQLTNFEFKRMISEFQFEFKLTNSVLQTEFRLICSELNLEILQKRFSDEDIMPRKWYQKMKVFSFLIYKPVANMPQILQRSTAKGVKLSISSILLYILNHFYFVFVLDYCFQ